MATHTVAALAQRVDDQRQRDDRRGTVHRRRILEGLVEVVGQVLR